jgi:hypothetical protein
MNQNILSGIQGNPEVMQAVSMAVQELLQDPDIDRESIDQMIRMLEFVMQNPDSYNEFRQTAIQGGMLDPEDLPEQYSEEMLTVVLLALKVVQQQMADGGPGFARGGLNKIAQMGRRGDSELAHINPFERRLLQAYGGSGMINPQTGLREFGFGRKLKKAFKAIAPVLPILLSVFAPGIGTAIGSALSGGALAGTAAGMLGGAAIGGLSSAAAGGNALKGALGGALGAGAGGALGGAIGDATGMTLSNTAQNVLGSSLIGGAQSAASGGDFLTGAVQGGVGGYAGSALSGAAGGFDGKLGAGLQTAGQQFGNALTMGADAKQALTQGALSGLAAAYAAPSAAPQKSIYDITPSDTGGLGLKAPSDLAVEGLRAPALNTTSFPSAGLGMDYGVNSGMTPTFRGPETMAADYSLYSQPQAPATSAQPEMGTGIQASPLNTIAAQTAELTPGTKGTVNNDSANKGFSVGNAAAMLPLLSMFRDAQTPEEIQQVVAKMTPEQQEYFNRPMRSWNWDTLSAAAKMQNLPVGSYIARNWDKVGGGMYNKPAEESTQKLARGGALNRLARGGGSGRDDTIDAKLSDGEYVMDAETVALLGDGSTDAGARRLDEMRAKIRQHKGKSMARGKFSANAKSPLAYLKGA